MLGIIKNVTEIILNIATAVGIIVALKKDDNNDKK